MIIVIAVIATIAFIGHLFPDVCCEEYLIDHDLPIYGAIATIAWWQFSFYVGTACLVIVVVSIQIHIMNRL